MKGKIIRITLDRMFGFIKGEDGNDYFFHGSGLVNTTFNLLKMNDPVEFDGNLTAKGYRAENVEVK